MNLPPEEIFDPGETVYVSEGCNVHEGVYYEFIEAPHPSHLITLSGDRPFVVEAGKGFIRAKTPRRKLAGQLIVFEDDKGRLSVYGPYADETKAQFINVFDKKFGHKILAKLDLEKHPVIFREGEGLPQTDGG